MTLLIIAAAPVLIILFYIYFRDKYEKEPIGKLLLSILLGAIIVLPIIYIEEGLEAIWEPTNQALNEKLISAFYESFAVASFTEELFKYLVFILIIWRSKNFNEKFDGIVYAVFISLGFALVENVLYVLGSGAGVGVLRALTAVPGHALFGIAMGYYFGLAKFSPSRKGILLSYAFLMPFILHGIYDFILFSENVLLLLIFVPYLIFMWIYGFKNLKKHSDSSVFKITNQTLTTPIAENNVVSSDNSSLSANSTENEIK